MTVLELQRHCQKASSHLGRAPVPLTGPPHRTRMLVRNQRLVHQTSRPQQLLPQQHLTQHTRPLHTMAQQRPNAKASKRVQLQMQLMPARCICLSFHAPPQPHTHTHTQSHTHIRTGGAAEAQQRSTEVSDRVSQTGLPTTGERDACGGRGQHRV